MPMEGAGENRTGVWECMPGRFARQLPDAELMHILSGACTFTPEGGEPHEIRAGDTLPPTRGAFGMCVKRCARSSSYSRERVRCGHRVGYPMPFASQNSDLLPGLNYIVGTWLAAHDGRILPVSNPASGETFASISDSGAHADFKAWRRMPAKQRAQISKRWDNLIAHTQDLGRLISSEQGKPLTGGTGKVPYASCVEWFAEEATHVDIYVQDAVHDVFVEKLAAQVSALKVGPATDPVSQIGPLIKARAVDKIERHVQDAARQSARIVTGDTRLRPEGKDGAFYLLRAHSADERDCHHRLLSRGDLRPHRSHHPLHRRSGSRRGRQCRAFRPSGVHLLARRASNLAPGRRAGNRDRRHRRRRAGCQGHTFLRRQGLGLWPRGIASRSRGNACTSSMHARASWIDWPWRLQTGREAGSHPHRIIQARPERRAPEEAPEQ
jgi:NAD-dependent aldehyde dehydrogenases